MSGRAHRRLLKQKELERLTAPVVPTAVEHDASESESESDAEPAVVQPKKLNPFALLMMEDDEDDQGAASSSHDEQEEEDEEEEVVVVAPAPRKGKAKKQQQQKKAKKKNAAAAAAAASASAAAADDDLSMEELERVLRAASAANHQSTRGGDDSGDDEDEPEEADAHGDALAALLATEPGHLDPDVELARMFGAESVANADRELAAGNAAAGRRRGGGGARGGAGAAAGMGGRAGGNGLRKSVLAGAPDPDWPPYHMTGAHAARTVVPRSALALHDSTGDQEVVEIDAADAKHKKTVLVIKHNKPFQQIQRQFLVAAASGDPNALVSLTQSYAPYHADTLLRLHRVAQVMRSTDEARMFLRRALYAVDRMFPPAATGGWAWTKPWPLQVPYTAPTNRVVHQTLLAQIGATARSAGGRTALETAKVLLGIDHADPMAVRAVIDGMGVRARESAWVRDWAAFVTSDGQDDAFPTVRFSAAIATWQLGDAAGAARDMAAAARWRPDVARALVPALALTGFDDANDQEPAPAVALHLHYCKPTWTDPPLVTWVSSLPAVKVTAAQAKRARTALAARVPDAVWRHVLAAEIQTLAPRLPMEMRTAAAMNAVDPVPPPTPVMMSAAAADDDALEDEEQTMVPVFFDPYANDDGDAAAVDMSADQQQGIFAALRNVLQGMAAGDRANAVAQLAGQLPAGVLRGLGLGGGGDAAPAGDVEDELDMDMDEEEDEWEQAPMDDADAAEQEWEDYAHLLLGDQDQQLQPDRHAEE
ncbi:transcriptional repressor TCF25-domain-containing protein [Blastocladiella britannica]|nr:transcriptional repressor TCF25-domain-containing protein [Blastocladiella britannica]